MTETSHGGVQRAGRAPGQGAAAVFWMLVLMGLATFAPCVILPEWRDYQALRAAEQVRQHRLDELEREVEHERRLLQAMRSDPAVIARLAQRDLRFLRTDARAVLVSVPPEDPTPEGVFVPQPVGPPPVVVRALSMLPAYDYDRVFCDKETRPLVMGMSLALIALAFVLFGRRPDSWVTRP